MALQQMFKLLALVWLLLAVSCRLLQADEIQGTLKIVENKYKSDLEDRVMTVRAAINSAQITNIVHQPIRVLAAEPSDGCSAFTIPKGHLDSSLSIYYLVRGGEGSCSYARKVEMAKQALGKGVIIVDSPKGVNNLKLRLNQKDKFVSLIINENEGNLLSSSPSFLAELNMGKAADVRNKKNVIEIWVSSLNEESYRILHQWKDVLEDIPSIAEKVTWSPRFAFYSCTSSQLCKAEFVSSCACGGQFCSPEQQSKSSNVLVREDIRQFLIFKHNPDLYLKYVKKFYKNCFQVYSSSKYVEDCATGIIHDLNIDDKVNTQIDHFLSSCAEQSDESNFKLYRSLALDRAKYMQIGHYPTIISNHEQLEFRSKDELKGQLCRKLSLQAQDGCLHVSESTIIMTIVSWIFYLLMFGLLLGAGAFVVIFFRNKLRRDMNKELKMQVSTAVEHYFTLSQAH